MPPASKKGVFLEIIRANLELTAGAKEKSLELQQFSAVQRLTHSTQHKALVIQWVVVGMMAGSTN